MKLFSKGHNYDTKSSRGIERSRNEEKTMKGHNDTVVITEIQTKKCSTDYSLYTNTQYNGYIRYNDKMTN